MQRIKAWTWKRKWRACGELRVVGDGTRAPPTRPRASNTALKFKICWSPLACNLGKLSSHLFFTLVVVSDVRFFIPCFQFLNICLPRTCLLSLSSPFQSTSRSGGIAHGGCICMGLSFPGFRNPCPGFGLCWRYGVYMHTDQPEFSYPCVNDKYSHLGFCWRYCSWGGQRCFCFFRDHGETRGILNTNTGLQM